MTRIEDSPGVIAELIDTYETSVGCLRKALALYLRSGERPDPAARRARRPRAHAEASTTTMKANSRAACTGASSTRAT